MLKFALDNRLEQIQSDIANEEQRLKMVKDNIDRCKREESWIITQAKKGTITEEQMDLQLRSSMEERERYETELKGRTSSYRLGKDVKHWCLALTTLKTIRPKKLPRIKRL